MDARASDPEWVARLHLLLAVQSSPLVLASVNRLWSATQRPRARPPGASFRLRGHRLPVRFAGIDAALLLAEAAATYP